jgi:hypothetical protein
MSSKHNHMQDLLVRSCHGCPMQGTSVGKCSLSALAPLRRTHLSAARAAACAQISAPILTCSNTLPCVPDFLAQSARRKRKQQLSSGQSNLPQLTGGLGHPTERTPNAAQESQR